MKVNICQLVLYYYICTVAIVCWEVYNDEKNVKEFMTSTKEK